MDSELASIPNLSVGKSDRMGRSLVKSGIVFIPFHIRLLDSGFADGKNEQSTSDVLVSSQIRLPGSELLYATTSATNVIIKLNFIVFNSKFFETYLDQLVASP